MHFDFDVDVKNGILLGFLLLAGGFLAVQAYWPSLKSNGFARWAVSLRCLVCLLLVLLLMEPILAFTMHRHRRPLVALMVDKSQSMRLEEDGRRRLDVVLELLRGDALRELGTAARLERVGFSEEIVSFSEGKIDSLFWDGRATDIAGALDRVREKVDEKGAVAAVLISDGAHNLGGQPERAALNLGIPIITVGVGDPRPPKDLALTSGVIDPLGYVGSEVSVQIGIRANGYDGDRGLVVVEEEGRRVAAEPVALTDGDQLLNLKLQPDHAGRHVYTVSVDVLPGERSEANNVLVLTTEVLESRIKVLLAGGSPSADFAYLRRLLEADPNLELDAIVSTRSGERKQDLGKVLRGVEDRDLIVLFDLPVAALAGAAERKLAEFVRDGGGLLFVGGLFFPKRADALPALTEVLPLKFSNGADAHAAGDFSVEVAETGKRHPIMRISAQPLDIQAEWSDLPPLLAFNPNGGARPDATVLLQHPVARVGGSKMPLVAVTRAGAGKSMMVSIRSFWRFGLMMWGVGQGDRVSRQFWGNAIRWLTTREDMERVRATTDRQIYRGGEPITFYARVLNALDLPEDGATVRVSVIEEGDAGEVLLQGLGEGRYRGKFSGLSQGDHAFRVRAEKGGVSLGEGTGRFAVGHYSLEYEDTRMNAQLLEEISELTGGQFVTPEGLPEALDALPLALQPTTQRFKFRLWGESWPLFVLLGLLTLEWSTRRRRGMI